MKKQKYYLYNLFTTITLKEDVELTAKEANEFNKKSGMLKYIKQNE